MGGVRVIWLGGVSAMVMCYWVRVRDSCRDVLVV